MIDGVKLVLRGTEYTVPPLCAADARSCQEEVKRLSRLGAFALQEDLDAACKVLFLALRENYPDLTQDKADRLVDYENVARVTVALLVGAIGFKRLEEAEKKGAAAPGEAQRPQNSTSTSSSGA